MCTNERICTPFNPTSQLLDMHPNTDVFIGMFKLRVTVEEKLGTAIYYCLKSRLVLLVGSHVATQGYKTDDWCFLKFTLLSTIESVCDEMLCVELRCTVTLGIAKWWGTHLINT